MIATNPTSSLGATRAVRLFAAGAAAVAAGLYVLIGLGVLDVGDAAAGGTPDLLAFGLLMGGVFLATALLLVRFASRPLWFAVAVLQLIVIVGYFAMSNLRVPAVETIGLLVKAAQGAVLVAVGWLLFAGRSAAEETSAATRR